MFVTLGMYCTGAFTAPGFQWSQLTPIARSPDRRVVRHASMIYERHQGPERSVIEQLEALIDLGVADVRDDLVIVPARTSRRNIVTVRTPWRRAHFSVRHATHALTGSPDDPPSVLPCEMLMGADLGTLWPSQSEQEALRELVRTTAVQYGYIHVGTDADRAHSEQLLMVMHESHRGEPAWASDIRHLARWRHVFGARVRGAYWGNVLPTHLVDAIGGLEALVATGASMVERLTPDLTYVQLTPTVGEALTEAGLERMEKLRAVLAPVTV